MKILIIGLGEIGSANAKYIHSLHRDDLVVEGFDISQEAVDRALKAGIISRQATSFKDFDVYLVAVSTHNPSDMSRPNLQAVHDVIDRIATEGKPNSLVCMESTIELGTCRPHGEDLYALKHIHLVHVPERFFRSEQKEHGVRQPRVFGAFDSCCKWRGLNFYRGILQIPLHTVNAIETAESSKIVENAKRYLDIAFAEELWLWCRKTGVPFKALRDACNTKWNVHIMEALNGVGLHCLPKDSAMFVRSGFGVCKIMESAIAQNQVYVETKQKEELLEV